MIPVGCSQGRSQGEAAAASIQRGLWDWDSTVWTSLCPVWSQESPAEGLFLFVEVFLTHFPNIPHSLFLPKYPGLMGLNQGDGLMLSVGIFLFHSPGSPNIPKKVEQFFLTGFNHPMGFFLD